MQKTKIQALARLLLRPVQSSLFVYLLLLNYVSNLGVCVFGFCDGFDIFAMAMMAALAAYVETAIYKLLPKKWPRLFWLLLLVVVHNVLIVVDYFLIYHFHLALGQDVVDILAETNPVEAENFLDTYLSWGSLTLWLLALACLNVVFVWLTPRAKRIRNVWKLFACCVLVGLVILCAGMYNYAVYRNGMRIPQYQTFTRVGYASYVMHQRMQKTNQVRKVCERVEAMSALSEKPTVVVVIGESFAASHSSLMAYDKPTNPLLQSRADTGSLHVMDNTVSIACGTHGAMLSVFSLDSLGVGFERLPLFPACFKAAGYRTVMLDNQYFVGSGVNFLSDAALSSTLFEKRNDHRYKYDLEMVETIVPDTVPTLYVIHLWGQHYAYADRYPKDYAYFKATDYDSKRWTEAQRKVIAHYDNATRYNDAVVNEIIKRFEGINSCVVYFSDHGEEVYELGNFMGHGSAEHSKDISYQLHVPLMVWTSPTYSRPEVPARLDSLCHAPLMTDDVSHLLLDLAGIRTAAYRPARSVISGRYNADKPRIVLHAIDYDKRQGAHP